MPQGMAESPELAYDVSHKFPIPLTRLTRFSGCFIFNVYHEKNGVSP
jgi:hypothetical protein